MIINVKQFGNCYISHKFTKKELEQFEQKVGFKVKQRKARILDSGYVLERI